ncbi:reverse transcriptase domain-containing protein [Tanacetum coccineum]
MTRSSTNELFTPYKEPEREFRSSRRHFKTLSLDELRSPDFNLLSDQEYSKEEEAEAMAETMEQYMSKTRMDYGLGEDLKTKFLNKYCPPGRTAKKMEEINNFQKEPDETLYQAWERFKELLMKCPQHYLTKMHEVILFYNGLDVPTRQILDLRGVVPTKTAEDAKKVIQEMAEYSQK